MNAMLTFPKSVIFLLIVSRVTLFLILDANFALYCILKQFRFYMNFSCRLVFHNDSQRRIRSSTNFSCSLVFPKLF